MMGDALDVKNDLDSVKNDLDPVKNDLEDSALEKTSDRVEPIHHVLMDEFQHGHFSDVVLSALEQSWKLHRVILLQSSFLCRLLLDNKSKTHICLNSFADEYLDSDSFQVFYFYKIALKDLYSFNLKFRSSHITIDNVISVLSASCFLEMVDLAQYCSDFVMESLAGRKNVTILAVRIERLKPKAQNLYTPYGPDHQFWSLLSSYYKILNDSCLSSICYSLSRYYIENDDYFDQEISNGSLVDEINYATPEEFLKSLPLYWIQRVISCDCLCLPREFDRYTLLKKTRLLAEKDHAVTPTRSVESAEVSPQTAVDLPVVKVPIQAPVKVSTPIKALNYLNSFFFESTAKKRKIDSSESSKEQTKLQNVMPDKRLIKQPKKKLASKEISWSEIFEKGIIYTYMTFSELETVKNDGQVNPHTVLSSYWLQAELSNTKAPDFLPSFRFACRFTKLTEFLSSSDKSLVSDSIFCAKVQYRVLLSKEGDAIKALLQRTRGDGYKISYQIYCFDHRNELTKDHLYKLMTPVTACDKLGDGHCNEIEIGELRKQNNTAVCLDEIWLVSVIKFHSAE
jgi:hypothetical protein